MTASAPIVSPDDIADLRRQLAAAVRRIADLERRVGESSDELSDVAPPLPVLVARLTGTVGTVRGASHLSCLSIDETATLLAGARMSDDWYAVVDGAGLEQGDILPRCPVYQLAELPFPIPNGYAPTIDIVVYDLIVMSQSCDLLNDKVETVLLAQVEGWPAFVAANATANPFVKSREYRKKLVDGVIPAYSLLNTFVGPPPMPWSVVNFHRLVTLPKTYLTRFAPTLGPRLRLRSPYLEHLSQAFARYFMRVGLPHPLHEFVTTGG